MIGPGSGRLLNRLLDSYGPSCVRAQDLDVVVAGASVHVAGRSRTTLCPFDACLGRIACFTRLHDVCGDRCVLRWSTGLDGDAPNTAGYMEGRRRLVAGSAYDGDGRHCWQGEHVIRPWVLRRHGQLVGRVRIKDFHEEDVLAGVDR